MMLNEIRSQHSKEVTKLGGTMYDNTGYRMDVNLWFRHKNEALFYLDSVGKVHGPMDQTYSVRLGPIQKSGKEIAFKREFLEESERDKWRKCSEFQNSNPIQFREETKHVETILRDVSSNNTNNCQKSYLTTATHVIPKCTNADIGNYSTSITKQNVKSTQGVTVNLTAPVEVIEKTSIREGRLIDELLEARNELNTLRRTKSVVDTSRLNDNSQNFYDEKYVSKVVTDVQPSMETARTRHISTRQDNTSVGLPQMSQMSSIQNSKTYVENHSTNQNVLDRGVLEEMRYQQNNVKPVSQSVPVTFTSKTKEIHTLNGGNVNRSGMRNEGGIQVVTPVQSVERSFAEPEDDEHDTHHEEKTVTIKRKITRRKKGTEKINTLRDSYIDNILSPLPNYETASDTEEDPLKTDIKAFEIIPLKQSSAYATPRIVEPIPNIIEEDVIVPQKKQADKSDPFENLRNMITEPIKLTEFQQSADWEYKDTNVPRVQPRKYLSNHHLSENTKETYINEKQNAPLSTYSARKENMKSQQMLDDKNTISRTLQSERNIGHRNEMTEEIETITLQPIGKGVQDLAASQGATFSRSGSRAATPRAFDGGAGTVRNNYYKEETKHFGNYNTMPTMPKFVKAQSVRNVNQSSNYDFNDSARRATSTTRAHNEPIRNMSYNRVATEQTFHRGGNSHSNDIGFNRAANEQMMNASNSRAANEQTVNSSWHTRTESYGGGGNQAYKSPILNQEIVTNNYAVNSTMEDQQSNLQMVLNSEEYWYQPHYSRDDVINYLRDKEPGSFIIRNSSTFAGAYGLGMKVASLPQNAVISNDPQGDLVRHFLIETVESASGNGVRLKGFANEMVYPSLAYLVHAHCHSAIALPSRLLLPQSVFTMMNSDNGNMSKAHYQSESYQRQQQQQQHTDSSKVQLLSQSHRSISSPGVNFMSVNHPNPLHQNYATKAMYLGKIEIDRLEGDRAIEYAVDKLLSKNPSKTSTVDIGLDSTNGITLTDELHKLFYTRHFPAQHVLYAGFDPKNREFHSVVLQSYGINRGRIIGIVVKKQKMILRENVVHLFCEINDSNDLGDVIEFVRTNYMRKI